MYEREKAFLGKKETKNSIVAQCVGNGVALAFLGFLLNQETQTWLT